MGGGQRGFSERGDADDYSIPDERRVQIVEQIPLKRFAEQSEMAAAIEFLASEEAAYSMYTVPPVDGGIAM